MRSDDTDIVRAVRATHGRKENNPDPAYITEFGRELRDQYGREGLIELYGRFIDGCGHFDLVVRRIIWAALARQCGAGLHVDPNVNFKHLETFTIGSGVFIGSESFIQGRFDGRCVIGDHVWIGPTSYLDARDLVLEDHVGWGPGAKVLGSVHIGVPLDEPIIKTDLTIKPVKVCAWADIGTNSVLLPGITVGKGAIVGAGAVVTKDVLPFSVVVGVPARFLRWREGYTPEDQVGNE
ncbi:N-acetyltransferase [Gammaproteobacteria bacterium]|nr:N-acetyltransferase [Gammaproteobacteria bacterium]